MSVWAQNSYLAQGNDIYFAFKNPTSIASKLLTVSNSLVDAPGIAIKLAILLNEQQPSPALGAGEGGPKQSSSIAEADEGEAAS